MKSFFSRSRGVSYVLAVMASVFVVTAFVFGSTTINNNISTDGTLSVSSTASIAGLGTFSGGVVIANSTSTITNLVTVNATSTSATTTNFAVLSGSTIFSLSPDSASTTSLIERYGGAATNTIVDAYINAFSFATSTVATPIISIDTTGGGRLGIGTTSAPMANLTVDSKNATSTLYIASPSGRTCLQMVATGNKPYRIYINSGTSLITSTTTVLVVEPGSCL